MVGRCPLLHAARARSCGYRAAKREGEFSSRIWIAERGSRVGHATAGQDRFRILDVLRWGMPDLLAVQAHLIRDRW
jgi:hypothetical protein